MIRNRSEFARRRARLGARSLVSFLQLVALGAAVPSSHATQLLAPAIGVPDSAMNGATVATPMTPSAAAYSNPAAITGFAPGAVGVGLGVPLGHSQLHTTTPPGYDTTNSFVAIAPDVGVVHETGFGLRWGLSVYGSLGSAFDSDADAAAGVPYDFYSSAGVSNASLMAAYPITDRLSVGAAISVLYGQVHLRYFAGDQFAYTLRGPGAQANVGLQYRPTDRIALGLSFRTPGMVWATGDDRLPAGDKQDVDLDLDMPAQVFVGINADVTDRLHLGLMGRWTDASTFGGSIFRFEDTPAANIPYIRSASDEWRIAAGARYGVTESVDATISFGYADAIVPDSWVSPLIMDAAEWKIGGGLSWTLPGGWSAWTIDSAVGYQPDEARNVSDAEAAIFPGRYVIGGTIWMIGVRTTL